MNAPIILIADRNPRLLNYLKRELISSHYALLHAKDGQEALSIVDSQNHIAVAVVELELPVVNGLYLIGRLAAKKPKAIIATTLLEHGLLFELATHLGADTIVRKPAKKRLLIEVVRPLLLPERMDFAQLVA